MNVHICLHGSLRDVLPRQNKGRVILEMPVGAKVSDIVKKLSLQGHVHLAVNDEITETWDLPLQEEDKIDIFRPAAGGTKRVS